MKNLQDVYESLQSLLPTSAKSGQIKSAAVAILWRKTPKLELFLVRRSLNLRFLPGFWSFPGGKAEIGDSGLKATAKRELQEETGIIVDLSAMVPAGRWVTPPAAMRFDTQFYLVPVPKNQEPDVSKSGGELMDGKWISPKDALDGFQCGELLINAPILGVLQALQDGLQGGATRAIEIAQRYESSWPRLRPVTGGIGKLALTTPTLPPATTTNCYVVGTESLIIVDPATPDLAEREALVRALDGRIAAGASITEIWLTHHHRDHVGAAEFLSDHYGVPICAHRITRELLVGECRVDKNLEHGETRTLGGQLPTKLTCVYTPGHARGHLCFWEDHTRSLIVGDMLASEGSILIDPDEGDMIDYLESLRQIDKLGARVLLPAHGHALSEPKQSIDAYIQHRMMRESKVVAALTPTPQSASDLVATVYDDTPQFLHPLAQRSLLSHLLKLEKESLASQNGGLWFSL